MSGKKTEQVIYEAYNHEKLELLHHLITNDPALGSAMIYLCRKDEVHALTNKLAEAGLHVDSIHGQKKPKASFLTGFVPLWDRPKWRLQLDPMLRIRCFFHHLRERINE